MKSPNSIHARSSAPSAAAARAIASPWTLHLRRHAGRYGLVVASVVASLPLSLALVILVAYAFNQLHNPIRTLPWIELVGEHASRWVKPWARGTPFEAGIPVEFQTQVFVPALLVVAVLVGLLKFAQEYLLEDVGERIAADVRHAMARGYSQLPYDKACMVEGAVLASVVGEDARDVRQTFTRLWGSIPADGLACLMYAAFLALLDTQLFALLIAILLPAAVVIRLTGKSLKRLARQGIKSQSQLLEALLEKMRGWQTIQVLGGVPRELRSFNVTNDRLFTVWRRSARAKALSSPLVEWLGVVAAACVLVIALRRISEGALSPGVLTAFLFTIAQLANASQTLSTQLQSARKGTEGLRRAHALVTSWVGPAQARILLAGEPDVGNETRSRASGGAEGKPRFRVHALETKALAVSNPGGGDMLAEGIDVALARGDFLAIAGPSGSGKSTLLRVLLGLEPQACGEIRVNGQTVDAAVYAKVAGDLAFLPQEPYLVEGSVAENVTYPSSYDADSEAIRARVVEALRKANLLHKEPESPVFGLSGGERQRLMFARAFFRDASLWIVDEATSALDTQNESAILGRLREEAAHHLVISVAHRESVKAVATHRLELGERGSPSPLQIRSESQSSDPARTPLKE